MSGAPLGALVRAEATKARRQPSTYVLGGILVGYVALIVAALASVLVAPPRQAGAPDLTAILAPLREDAVGFVASIASGIATILLVVFAAQCMAQEFSRGTLRTLLLHRARRDDVALAKLATIGLVSLASALIVVVGAILGAAAFSAATGEALLKVDAGSLALRFARIAAGLACWGAIAFGATLSMRSLGAGVGTTLGVLIVGGAFMDLLRTLGTYGVWAGRTLPNPAVDAISGSRGIDAASWAWIVPSLLVYVVGLNAFAIWRLRRLDVISATK